jgi:hypothetical protein
MFPDPDAAAADELEVVLLALAQPASNVTVAAASSDARS